MITDGKPHRVALYFTPPPGDPLGEAAARWLGRDVWGADTDVYRAGNYTETARRYGFHATLKAPFRLVQGKSLDGLQRGLDDFTGARAAFRMPGLSIGRLGPHFALVQEDGGDDAMSTFAAALVQAFEPFRAPLTEAEVARRRQVGLDAREDANLRRYGYPYVLDTFRFHMTLAGPVPEADREGVGATLRRRFATHLGKPVSVTAVTLFVEDAPGDAFRAVSRHTLLGPV